jgi:uncharacterized protein (TIGR01777 family)
VIGITGATGFIGHRLFQRLRLEGQPVRALARPLAPAAVQGCTAIVHLAGEPIAQRWTPEVKKRIRESRVEGTRRLIELITSVAKPASTLVCGSAVGYYGDRGDEILTETSPPGTGFLPDTCVEWETAAREAEGAGTRVVSLRTGLVLGGGGALTRMLPPFRFGLGGPIGSGRQWMSWIHIDDVVELILFALRERRVTGPLNAVAPEPVRNSEFTRALAAAVHRPAILPVPVFALKIVFGEMASVMTTSQRVMPEAAQAAGFRYRYEQIRPALESAVHDHSS